MINLWTTPRTGSHWYAKKLARDCNGYSLHEFFNRNIYLYYFINTEGRVYFLKEYQPGCYYLDYSLSADGRIISSEVYDKHTRTVLGEESHRLSLFRQSNTAGLVLSNHVFPIRPEIYKELRETASRNIFLHRSNIRNQLSSYCVSYATRHFVNYGNGMTPAPVGLHVERHVLDNIAHRIRVWRTLDKTDSEIVEYENIDFTEYIDDQMPTRQNVHDVFENLDDETKFYVLKLEKELL